MSSFDVQKVPLDQKILVEASAGTGKTFSIAILILRLILERDINISKMLIVTFTNDAVYELQQRVRKFLFIALHYIKHGTIDDEHQAIKDLIDAIQLSQEAKWDRIRDSYLLLDESNIMTIHGFAQASLRDFAFETKQDFGVELITDISDYKDEVINEFWRREVSTLPTIAIEHYLDLVDLKNECKQLIHYYLNDVTYYPLADFDKDYKKQLAEIIKTINLAHSQAEGLENLDEAAISKNLKLSLLGILSEQYLPQIDNRVRAARLLTFDKMIGNLHEAVVTNLANQAVLIDLLRKRYEAVFIDEFQDTDKIQFEIFRSLFIDEDYTQPVFLIGDPKQSIYSFRGADVDSYLAAKSLIQPQNILTMNTNYRTSVPLVNAVNNFYLEDIDYPFAYDDNRISYAEVNAKVSNQISIQDKLLNFFTFPNKKTIGIDVANYISQLLADEHMTIEGRRLKPSDFAILIRTKNDMDFLLEELANLNIPAVMVNDDTVLSSDEKKSVQLLLHAMIHPTFQNIRSAFFLSFLAKDINQLDAMSELEKVAYINQFSEYRTILIEDGIYAAFERFYTDYDLNWQYAQDTSSLRIITNVRQIIELLNELQIEENKTPEELLLWLMQDRDQLKNEDKYTLRMESDDDAVKITTIHKSKGLEYNWVIVLGMEGELKRRNSTHFEIKIDDKKYYYAKDLSKQFDDLHKQQQNHERRRLLYVAITRAKYKCDFFLSTNGMKSNTFADFKHKVQDTFNSQFDIESGIRFIPAKPEKITTNPIPNFASPNSSWRKFSFSSLSLHQMWEQLLGENEAYETIDSFVFQQLGRGKAFGDVLHHFLEEIDFTDDFTDIDTINRINKNQIRKFNKNIITSEDDNYMDSIILFLQQLTQTVVTINGDTIALNKIAQHQKAIEVPFHFDIKGDRTAIDILLEKYDIPTQWRSTPLFKGIMSGFIDLLFEQNGKYYILDWKSNYLGNHMEAYHPEHVKAAMAINDYHLQYLIYTVAVYQYLKMKIKDFDYDLHFGGVIYAFVRGVRKGSDYGLFTTKPDKQLIESLLHLMKGKKELV